MATAEYKYLKDVLGLQSVVVPEGIDEAFSPPFQVHGDLQAPLAVISFQSLNQNERELVQKMLKAIHVDQLLSVEFEPSVDSSNWQEFNEAYQGKAYWFFGQRPEYVKCTLPYLDLPALSSLLDQSDPVALNTLKKKVWGQLKSFQSEVKL